MTRPYKLSSSTPLPPSHPLHWARFWPDLQRLHRGRNEARQDLVLWLANLYHGAVRCGLPVGFCSVQVRLMDLRDWVRDYQPALDHFFIVKQRGYYVNEETTDLTTLVPKQLPASELKLVDRTVEQLRYKVPALPEGDTVISKVYVNKTLHREALIEQVLLCGRPELVPQLNWILTQPSNELNFHFVPSGKLKLRDTSVWPISGIETWPSWLREELFGPGIDLDSAYVQFLLKILHKVYHGREHMVQLLFPDLVRLLHDKENFREELCTQVLGIPFIDKNRSLIKRVMMSLANGSRISPQLLTSGSGFSLTAELIVEAATEATLLDLTVIGRRLQLIANQFSSAKRLAASHLLKSSPNKQNIKKVFAEYFQWERQARYAVWEEVGRHGIMVHDGIDGIPTEYLTDLNSIMEKLELKLTT